MVAIALASAFCFGLALLLTQPGLRHLGPVEGACVAIPTATALFLALWPFTVGFREWTGQGALVFGLVGCLFPALVTILTFAANRRIGPNLTGALGNLAPLFAVLIAVAVLGERLGPPQIAAVLAIVLGVVLLYLAPARAWTTAVRWAFALPLAAAVVRGLVQPVVKVGLAAWPNPFAAVTIGYVVSSLVVLGFMAARNRGRPVPFDRAGWSWFAGVGLANGAAVFLLYQALALGPVTRVAPLVACYPLVTLALSRFVPGVEPLTPATWTGVGLTVVGVALLLLG